MDASTLYVSDKFLATRFGVTRAAIWRWAVDTDFPRPIRLGAQCTRWRLTDVEAWEQTRLPPGPEESARKRALIAPYAEQRRKSKPAPEAAAG